MAFELAAFALDIIANLIADAVAGVVTEATLPYFTRRRMKRRVEDATAEVIEPMLPFLAAEGLKEDQQRLLITVVTDELRPVANDTARLMSGSLDGQKIFDQLYAIRPLPRLILDEGLKDTYALLFPRIATLLCKLPAAVKEWETEAWTENFRRFDEIASQLRALFGRIDELALAPNRDADEALSLVRRALAQKIGLELDLTGLRSDRPVAGRFDDFFVHPALTYLSDKKRARTKNIGDANTSFRHFVVSGDHAVIVGAPGAGKSTWTKWLQRQALTPAWHGVAVRIELRRLNMTSLPSVYELVRLSVSRHLADELPNDRITRWFRTKLIMFLFDGFDEIRPADRDAVLEWIAGLREVVRACSFVVTSRPLTTDHLERLGAAWQTWNVESFDESRVVEYIRRWYAHTPLAVEDNVDIDAAALARTWRDDPTIGPLTGNPLLLSTLLMVHHLDGSLPSGRSQLYRRYVDGMLGIWDDRRQVAATNLQLTLEQKRQIIRAFALYLFDTEREQLDESDAVKWLETLLRRLKLDLDSEAVLNTLRERSGLIVGPGLYSFAHKSIAEFLVADAILQGDQRDRQGRRVDRFSLFEHRDDDRWNTVTFLWAGLAPVADVASFVDELLDAKAIALAGGVLFDQYERLPAEERRALILKLLSELSGGGSEASRLRLDRSAFIVSRPRDERERLSIPTFDMRRLVPNAALHSLVFRGLTDHTLLWHDRDVLVGHVRELFWMWAATRYRERDVWRECLREGPPNDGDAALWSLWIAERSFQVVMRDMPDQLAAAIDDYCEALPQAAGLVVPAALSAVLDIYYSDVEKVRKSCKNHMVALLGVISHLSAKSVDDKWLEQTTDWIVGFDEAAGDLLELFRKAIHGVLGEDAAFAVPVGQAYAFLDRLQSERDRLSRK